MQTFSAIQHSQPHMTLYQEFIFLTWGGNIFLNIVSLIMISPDFFIAYWIPPSSIRITILLCNSLTDTCDNNFGTNYSVVFPSMVILRQFLAIGDSTIWGWQKIKNDRTHT